MRALPYWSMFVVAWVIYLGLDRGGAWTAAGLLFVFVLIPLLEPLLGLRTDNDGTDGPVRQWVHDAPLWAWIPAQLALQVHALELVVDGALPGWQAVVAAISVGVVTAGGGIVVAHELIHRKTKAERAGGELLMASVTYTHFCIEHVYGHHRNVATPLDPVSSRLGESVYRFLPRAIFGSLISAISIERARTRRLGIPFFNLRHRIFRYAVTQALIYAVLAITVGPVGVLFWAGQSLAAVLFLEVINYVEHYGLARRELEPGVYERVKPWHSWNASHRLTNWLLYNLQRHSDHHYLASRPYHLLRHYDDVPQLPAGYATMVLLALAPPLWRRVMDPRVHAWNLRSEDNQAAA